VGKLCREKGIFNVPIYVKLQGGVEGGWENDIQGCSLGRDFEHTWCPNYLTFREKVTLGAEI